MTDRLIIFTRYPLPGRTKTRTIAALGAAGAASLQRRMTERNLGRLTRCHASLEIRYTGGTEAQMRQWLGDEFTYREQGEGDLGMRMLRAVTEALETGAQRVAIVGTDCPNLDDTIVDRGLAMLHQHDLVLGPAVDGGYYYIGVRQPIAELFQNIDWGSDRVLAQTVAAASSLGIEPVLLPRLADVDRPEDLPLWEESIATDKISIVVPVLNEEKTLEATLQRARSGTNIELIVVDGGSKDNTVAIAENNSDRVLQTEPGRAQQMNAGAAIATGDILLFLHGDTLLPKNFDRRIRETLNYNHTIAGAFDLKIDAEDPGLYWVERGVKLRSRWLQLPYGDQGIFMRSFTFQRLGMFAPMPLLEDFDLVRRLQKLGQIAIVPDPVLTSGRRWQKLGVWQTTWVNQLTIVGYFLGVPVERLAQWYRTQRPAPGSKR